MPHRDEHIIIFEHRDFRGRHRHLFGQEANLNHAEDNTLNDKMSSFVILSGTWQFFRHANFVEKVGGNLGPGQYEWVGDFGIPNDAVSSLKALWSKSKHLTSGTGSSFPGRCSAQETSNQPGATGCVREYDLKTRFDDSTGSLVLGCQTITEVTRIESDKDAGMSKAVKESFLKDKAVDLTDVNVKTTNGVSRFERDRLLTGGERACNQTRVESGWRSGGDHLEVKK